MTIEEKGRTMHVYWASTCGDCPLESDCTTGKQRRVRRCAIGPARVTAALSILGIASGGLSGAPGQWPFLIVEPEIRLADGRVPRSPCCFLNTWATWLMVPLFA